MGVKPELERRLIRRALLVTAHPDDESIGAGVLMQRLPAAAVLCCTNGSPKVERFWRDKGFRSREEYAEARARELAQAAEIAGVAWAKMLPIADQELYLNLAEAIARVSDAVREFRPEILVTHAYEGGHPDHDACSFVAATVAGDTGLPVWEMPLYHGPTAAKVRQRFRDDATECVEIVPSIEELRIKRELWQAHASQTPVIRTFDVELPELFRPQPRYDYATPADGERERYSSIDISQRAVCEKFVEFRRGAVTR
jgi:LmbE family N-acetylglucosaminyl deacetylase